MYARPFIDSLDFARNGQRISGEVPIVELARLLDVLDNPQGVLHYAVHGEQDRQGAGWLEVEVTGYCQLRCQRCLRSLDYPVQLHTCLMLRDQASLDALGDEDEEFDSVLAEARLDVLGLLEEEILLSLPFAPKHELGACQAADGKSLQREGVHPFAALAKLKRN